MVPGRHDQRRLQLRRRHLATRANQTAIIFEGDDPGVSRHITYRELHTEVCRFANVLKKNGVKKGDRVTIYLPMIPEAAYAMLACARIGAVHSIVFGGFSPDSLANRIEDCDSRLVITADEGLRGGKHVHLKKNVDVADAKVKGGIEKVVVVRHTGGHVNMQAGRDVWYHEEAAAVSTHCPVEEMAAEDPLFILYTSGSTGKPKGALHTTGGYLVYASMTHQYVFDYHDGDVYWCTADVGWVTGHSYIVYGPLANGATTLMFEGIPTYPSVSRFWEVIDKHKVNIFYTAPTAIRSLMGAGEEAVKKTSRASLRLLGSVGEPINPEAWEWYHRVVGGARCPIVDTWWQTETGGILITPLPGATALKPAPRRGRSSVSCRRWSTRTARFWTAPARAPRDRRQLAGADAHGLRRPQALHGDLFLHLREQVLHRRRLPARRRRLLLDHRTRRRRHQRLRHRMGTAEVESALVSHPRVSEAAVVGYPHDIKGQGIYAYVTLMQGETATEDLRKELVSHVRKEIGPIATPDLIQFAPGLPKTRSARSCAASCARSPRTSSARSATPRRWPIPRWSTI